MDQDKFTREWRKPHNEELLNPYSSPSKIGITKSMKIKWAGNVVRMK
jgi:hypothetical protein